MPMQVKRRKARKAKAVAGKVLWVGPGGPVKKLTGAKRKAGKKKAAKKR
ncbi:MAG TPA: hypothetical protein VGT78_03090 [Rhizomicrobium sp.]|nr:hypothetical protein [Rhizomicrobium sp.]